MSNWSAFFAKFSGSYNTIVQQIRDDAAITDIDSFYQLRTILQNGELPAKLAPLTSTSTGFLHEWATFLDVQKGTVSSGTQAAEPGYSDGKWIEFKTKFLAEYDDVIQGLRDDIKYSYFQTWAQYIDDFGADYQALVGALQVDSILGYSDLSVFLNEDQSNIYNKLLLLNSASSFINELALLLNSKKTGLTTESTWTDYKNNFSTEWQTMIDKLQLDLAGMSWATFYAKSVADHKSDLAISGDQVFFEIAQVLVNYKDADWEKFLALSLTDLRDKLADLDSGSVFFSAYSDVLSSEMDDLINLYDKMIDEFDEADRAVMADLIEYFQTTADGGITDFEDFLDKTENEVSSYITSFLDATEGTNYVSYIASGIQAAADSAYTGCNNSIEKDQLFYENLTSGLFEGFGDFYSTMIENTTITSHEDLKTGTTSQSALETDLKALSCNHPFIHNQARNVISVASLMIPKYTYSFRFHGKLMDDETSPEPIANMFAELVNTTSSEVISSALTDEGGHFFLDYTILHEQQVLPSTQTFDVLILNELDELIHTESDVVVTVNDESATTITITRPDIDKPSSATITNIFIDHPSVILPSELSSYLSSEGYSVLFDIRSVGGLTNHDFTGSDPFVDNTDTDVQAAIELIDQHASLDGLNPNSIIINQDLIDAGYKYVADIADSTLDSFIMDTVAFLTESDATDMFNEAKQQDVLKQTLAAALVVGKQYSSPLNAGLSGNIWSEDWEEIERKLSLAYKENAYVPDEESAVSPLAYLYDLITYISTNIKDYTSDIDVSFLEDNLHQRFSDLAGSTNAVGEKVNRTRAMVEILRRYLVASSVSTSSSDIQTYLEYAYRFILAQLNIDYNQLGQMIKASDTKRAEFANLNKISESAIDDLYFNLSAGTTLLSEEKLAETFGIKDSSQPPLVTGTKITASDTYNVIEEWHLENLQYLMNTDEQGYVYVSISKAAGSPEDTYTIDVFKASSEADKIATGSLDTAQTSGIINLKPVNQSTVHGYIKFNYQGSDLTDVKISSFPLYTSARLAYQYSKWTETDTTVVLIDPDIILPDDIVHLYNLSSGAMDLWESRKTDLDSQMDTINNYSTSSSTATAYAISDIPDSLGLIEETIYTVDTTNKIQVAYNGGAFASFSTANVGSTPGHLRSNDNSLYLAEGASSKIHKYTTQGSNHQTVDDTTGNITYTSANSANLKFKDMFFRSNGKVLVGATDTTNSKDFLVEFSPATQAQYTGNRILWDNDGNAYVLNTIAPSIIKFDLLGNAISSYGHSVDNELHYYKLETTTLSDENGTTSGSINGGTSVTGKFTQGVALDGFQDYINLDDLSETNTFSISFWINIDNVDKKDIQLIASIAKDANKGIAIYAEKSTLYLTHWCHNGSEYLLEPTSIEVSEGLISQTWHHIAMTFSSNNDGTLTDDGVKLYLDGDLKGSTNCMKMDGTIETFLGLDGNKSLKSHNYNPNTDEYGSITSLNATKGTFDEIKIFDRALTDTDCAALYDSDVSVAISSPSAIALSSSGEVYVLDAGTGKINIFENDGNYITQISLQDFAGGETLPALAVDYQGYIYVADQDANLIQVFNSNGVAQSDITGFTEIRDIHIDADNRLYVADTDTVTPANSEVALYTLLGGVATAGTSITEAKSGSGITKPSGVTTDKYGNVYIVDDGSKRIIQYDEDHTYINEWGDSNNFMWSSLTLIGAMGQISISSGGQIFFTLGDVGSDAILCETYVPVETELTGTGGKLNSLVVNRRDEVFVSLTADNKVIRYNPVSQILDEICSSGSSDGQVTAPKKLAIDGFDRIYIADSGNNRVQMVDRTGEFIRNLATSTALASSSNSLTGVSAIALNSNLTIVINGEDSGSNKKVFTFDVQAGLAGLLAESGFIESNAETISQIYYDEKNGQDITSSLVSLGLSQPAFRYLVDTILATGEPDEETWNNLYHICVQAYKNKQATSWKNAETSAGITLTPEHFRVRSREKYEESRTYFPWRTGYLERLQWVERLKDRNNVVNSTISSVQTSADDTDTKCLPSLKSILISLSSATGSTIDIKTQTLSNELCIDLKDNAGRKSTHVALAIETLQSLVWRLRTGQLSNSLTNLNYVGNNLDAEWKWRSSYKTWKSAQFVNIFPENLLFPEIKPNQTEAFQKLVQSLNDNPLISPTDACTLSNEYATYLGEISNFDQVIGTYSFIYEGSKDPCGHYNPTGVDESMDNDGKITTSNEAIPVIYFYGLKKASGKIYYCIYRYEDEPDATEKDASGESMIISDWREVPNVVNAIELSASVSYPKQPRGSGYPQPVQRVTLYYHQEESTIHRPVSVTLDAKKNEWLKPKNIKLPSDVSDKNVQIFVADDFLSQTKLVVAEFGVTDHYYSCFIDGLTGEIVSPGWKEIGPHKLSKWKMEKVETYRWFRRGTSEERYAPKEYGFGADWEREDKIHYQDVWLVKKYDLNYYVIGAQGKAVLFKGVSTEGNENAGGLFFLAFYDLLMGAKTGSTQVLLADLDPSKLLNPKVESFMRFQDSDTEYFIVFRGENGEGYFNHVELKVSSWSNGYISCTIKNQGKWVGHEPIHSIISSPESKNDVLFESSSSSLKLLAAAVQKMDSGAFAITKVSAVLDSSNNIIRAGLLFPKREISPRSVKWFEPIMRNGIPTESYSTVYRDFVLSLRPVGEDSSYRKAQLRALSDSMRTHMRSTLYNYFEEAYYYIPIMIADKLQRNGHYKEALDWYRLIYDYSLDESGSKIYPLLKEEENKSNVLTAFDAATSDPTNPHALAKQRYNAFTRYTLAAIARCMIEYGDDEFTQDTGESLVIAYSLYERALQVLEEAGYNETFTEADLLIENMDDSKTDNESFSPWSGNWQMIRDKLAEIRTLDNQDSTDDLKGLITYIEGILGNGGSLADYNHSTIVTALSQIDGEIERVRQSESRALDYNTKQAYTIKKIHFPFFKIKLKHKKFIPGTLKVNYNFGIPRNPVKDYLAMYAEINLYKLRSGMNITGMVRNLDVYATSTDATTGMTYVGVGGQIITSGTTYGATQSPYHYKIILERAKQLAQLAGQMENAMLNALEKYDAEQYSLKRAEQDLAIAEESINLQDLRLEQAELGIDLAIKQKERADVSVNQMLSWLSRDFNSYYSEILKYYKNLRNLSIAYTTAASTASVLTSVGSSLALDSGLGAGSFGYAAVFNGLAGAAQVGIDLVNYNIQVASLKLSHDQNRDNWMYQKNLALKDKEIAQIQESIARSQTRVVGQEKRMAELQRNFAESTADFLANKFTNAELYRWMGQVLQGVYSYFLKQATNMAQQASQQMAFELQERVPVNLQEDYWRISTTGSQFQQGANQDRKGLTGSARLLEDIYKLDQHAFENDKRKLELNKTISLASLFPYEFEQFKDSGVLSFSTTSELFDRDFPGHYLRLIKQVKVNVVALVPPTQGLKASLVNNGISSTVIGGKGVPFTNSYVVKQPETIALTGSNAANGLFELVSVYNQEKLLPFEGLGVNTSWEFRMPKASNFFDYNTIADVIFSIDYSSKQDFLYEQEVKNRLDTEITSQRAFSFKNSLPDQWYDLLHPEETADPMKVSFELTEKDFPANISDIELEELFISLDTADVDNEAYKIKLKLTLDNGVQAEDEAVSNATNSFNSSTDLTNFEEAVDKSPIGIWTLEFPSYLRKVNVDDLETDSHEDVIRLLQNGTIEDIFLIITYKGQTAKW